MSVTCNVDDGSMGSSGSRRERHRRVLLSATADSDVCVLSTRARPGTTVCLEDEDSSGHCVRLVVALTDAGRTHLTEIIATWDLLTILGGLTEDGGGTDFGPLQEALGERLVALPDASASPPPGAIGYWDAAPDFALVVLTATGERRFISRIGDVTSTNAVGLLDVRAPSLLP